MAIMLPVDVSDLGAVLEAAQVARCRVDAAQHFTAALECIQNVTRDPRGAAWWAEKADLHLADAAACEMRANYGQWPEERV